MKRPMEAEMNLKIQLKRDFLISQAILRKKGIDEIMEIMNTPDHLIAKIESENKNKSLV